MERPPPPAPGNGYCTRPRQLDCAHDSGLRELTVYFQTTIGFRPTLQNQHDDAVTKGQPDRAELFGRLLNAVDRDTS